MKRLVLTTALALGAIATPAGADDGCKHGTHAVAGWTPGASWTTGPTLVVDGRKVRWTGAGVDFAVIEGTGGERFSDAASPARAATTVTSVVLCAS